MNIRRQYQNNRISKKSEITENIKFGTNKNNVMQKES